MKKQALGFALTAALGFSTPLLAAGAAQNIHVYKSPTCGCCKDWVNHLEANGFEVEVTETQNLNPVKIDAGLTPALASCHTAFVGDYVIEGHVPADDIHRLIAEAPQAKGLSVPGMPMGSPGMEMGDRKDHYQVLMFNDKGQTRVFSEYN
ncbi:DUF411 domain-containing protein [Marinobacter sp. M216]|uniref:DUF411 domain-containing protein n=1 Tax=Marinobacter albus TaxID=3030833 RepID=A0ABT7H7W9_9GAMM|nr:MULTISPECIES: DUF411 domain-containing protein [unclassified Marinobacter]MBW7471584.1 DUF411 domain-containing protein [Marinobacter sp. F4218]MDK9556137.1 DUF411 domain-containing protein [Marinobacter sp. M216]